MRAVMKHSKSLCMEIVEASPRITVEDEKIFDLLHKQPDIAWMMSTTADALFHNEVFYKYTGRTPAFMRNWAWQDFLPVEEIPRVATSLYNALATAEMWEQIYPLRSCDGTYRQYLAKAAPVYNGKGLIKYCVGSATDVTDYLNPKKLLTLR